MKTYKLSEVKQVCEAIYENKINDRTWLRWKQKLCFEKNIREVSEAQMEQMLTLANMKRTAPLNKITLTQVVKSKSEALKQLSETRESYTLYLLPDYCEGSDLLNIIYMATCRKVSRRTLYRWGIELKHEYSTTKKYSKDVIQLFISRVFVDDTNRHSAGV